MTNNEKTVVTVSRKWDNPEIKTTISDIGISLEMSIDDFETAMLEEIGSVTMTFTKEKFREKFSLALANVIGGIKKESAKVVN